MARCNRTHHTTDQEPCPPDTPAPPALLSQAEIAERRAVATGTTERQRWQVIGMLAAGASVAVIVAATDYQPRAIRHIVQHYREAGPARTVRAQPRFYHRRCSVSFAQYYVIPQPTAAAGPGRTSQWIAARTGKRMHRQRGWEYCGG